MFTYDISVRLPMYFSLVTLIIKKGTVFLAQQDAHGLCGTIATDEQLYTWHALA